MSQWVKCADGGEYCDFTGQYEVRYGKGGTWLEPQVFTDGVDCQNATFGGDPMYGVVKECWVRPYVPPAPPPPPVATPVPMPQQQPQGFELSQTTLLLIAGGVLLLMFGGGKR